MTAGGPPEPGIYLGAVMHRRMAPLGYRFAYRVYSLWLDLDCLQSSLAGLRGLSLNRFNLVSVHERDFGPRDGSPLKPWIEARLAEQGVQIPGLKVFLFAMPRVLGYQFNPLSLWYCYNAHGQLVAVLGEVHNTFGEMHGYLMHNEGAAISGAVRAEADKCFYVSPFIGMQARYRFRLSVPGPSIHIGIHETAPDDSGRQQPLLVATQTGKWHPLSDAELWRAFWGVPLVTLKAIVMIHWQALRLWWRRARFYHQEPLPPAVVSAVRVAERSAAPPSAVPNAGR